MDACDGRLSSYTKEGHQTIDKTSIINVSEVTHIMNQSEMFEGN